MKKITAKVIISCLGVFLMTGGKTNAQAVSDTFHFSNTIVSFTVPNGVTSVTIQAQGAQGGDGNYNGFSPGGHGANLTGTFTVTPGHVLKILAGQKPAQDSNNGGANGGGGGSFVWDSTNSNTLLIAAGGGGGSCHYNPLPPNGRDADLADSGTMGTYDDTNNINLAPGGQNGNGGGAYWEGSGGAGWLTNGADGTGNCSQTYGGKTPLNGGQGGIGTASNGGFGGGGAAGSCWWSGGGGGGYSGGSGSGGTEGGGGGGGSFNGGTSQTNFVTTDTGSGWVVIKYNANLTDTVVLNYNDSIRYWKVPCGVSQITVTAMGATGGRTIGDSLYGGKGAKLTGMFNVTPDSTLKILVGGRGGDGNGGGGGGGGSFVTDIQNNPLIIAGGGGGVSCFLSEDTMQIMRIDATVADSGLTGNSRDGNAPSNYGVGGRNGNGATNASGGGPCGGNAGGLLTDGQSNGCCTINTHGFAFVNGGAGGIDNGCNAGGPGGFGCAGSGASEGGGGGGGYSGGGGSWHHPTNGGGGGSYNGGFNQTNLSAFNALGNGQVIITYTRYSVASNLIANQTSGCNGSASVVITGGISPYTFAWTPSGGTKDTAVNLCAGTYCCKVTDASGCMDSACVVIMNTSGIKNISNANAVSIYPNPTKGNFTISGVAKGEVIKVYNYLGMQISSQVVDNNTSLNYDISDKSNGIYLIRVQKADGSLITEKRIIKAQ